MAFNFFLLINCGIFSSKRAKILLHINLSTILSIHHLFSLPVTIDKNRISASPSVYNLNHFEYFSNRIVDVTFVRRIFGWFTLGLKWSSGGITICKISVETRGTPSGVRVRAGSRCQIESILLIDYVVYLLKVIDEV